MPGKKLSAATKKGKSKSINQKVTHKKGTSKSNQKIAKPAVPAVKKIPAIKDPMSKSAIIATLSEVTALSKKEVNSVLEALTELISAHIKARGPGICVLLGLIKILVVKKPAKPARKGVNPFTGEEIMIKAKPACKAVKIKPLKKLKEMVDN